MRGDKWVEHPTTHGIEIKQVIVDAPNNGTRIILNGWDFGGQRVYRPTHQLFFSAPAVYLVVWKPRDGSQQGSVREWIGLVKHREPEAKIVVVATHGGPDQNQPDIDRQELWDLFGKDTVVDFFHIDSKPDTNGRRHNVAELRDAIAHLASYLPEVGRAVPNRWQDAREVLRQMDAAYLPLEDLLKLCRDLHMEDDEARLFLTISHRLGHLIHYAQDLALRDIVVLKPDWLATAISFVLNDSKTRDNKGLIDFARLGELWNNPARDTEFRYPPNLHPLFLRLMERFDISYKVSLPTEASDAIQFWQLLRDTLGKTFGTLNHSPELRYTSLIAQLVPEVRPDPIPCWDGCMGDANIEKTQICRIVDDYKGRPAQAEGLFFQLIVRLHKYSLGRENFAESVHWRRGLVLDDEYNGRALLEEVDNNIRITVRAPYPETFLAVLTHEVEWLVEKFWPGLRCDVTVPCLNPELCTGLFEVRKLIENQVRGRREQPCPVCNVWQSIELLLHNAPIAQPEPTVALFAEFAEVKEELGIVRQQLAYQGKKMMGRFDRLDDRTRRTLSLVDGLYGELLKMLMDEAKDGPRLFSFVPAAPSMFNPERWISERFLLTLWCEHSRLPLPALNGKNSRKGVYELRLKHEWLKRATPFLKLLIGTLILALPVASSGIKWALDDTVFNSIQEQLDFGKEIVDASLGASEKIVDWSDSADTILLPNSEAIRACGAAVRELHALLKSKDPGFGGLVRVMNKRHEFMWVHEQFAGEY